MTSIRITKRCTAGVAIPSESRTYTPGEVVRVSDVCARFLMGMGTAERVPAGTESRSYPTPRQRVLLQRLSRY